MMTTQSCPMCDKPRLPRATNPTFPFCSNRCRMLDLARWLDGDYRIASGPGATERDGPGELDLIAAQAIAGLSEDELPS